MATTAPNSAEALDAFAAGATPPLARQQALTTLIRAKVLPKRADDPAIAAGRSHLLALALAPTAEPADKLLAIAECIRLGQVVKRWAPEITEALYPAFATELPPPGLLAEADDRLNLARACAAMSAPWIGDYLASAIAEEETGEKARAEMVAALLARADSLAAAMQQLTASFWALRPKTDAPGDTVARRLARTLIALRAALVATELEPGERLGKALRELLALPLSSIGKPETDKVAVDLTREAFLTVHDIIRTRFSVVTDPQMYGVVAFCRTLIPGTSWPRAVTQPLERLIADVSEALLLLGRQGQCDQALRSQLDVLSGNAKRGSIIAAQLAARHPGLPEDVRYWLEQGRMRTTRPASNAAIEAASSNADESIGVALQTMRQVKNLCENLREPLTSSLAIYEPDLGAAAERLLDHIRMLTVQVEQVATLRSLDLYGVPGEDIEMSAKFFTAVGNAPRQRMTVRMPATVRKRADGSPGDVVTKGIVE